MASDDTAWQQRANEALERLTRSGSPREARDVVAANPVLTHPFVSSRLGELAEHLRQRGDVRDAASMEHWQRVLRRFRELGLQEGYLEFVIEALSGATTAQEHRRIVKENPDLRSAATAAYLQRRVTESAAAGESIAVTKYTMAKALINAARIKDQPAGPAGIENAIGAFISGFVLDTDPAMNRRLLESRPELLKPPLNFLAGSFFDSEILKAQAAADLVGIKSLRTRRRLFLRCQEVGVARAFDELARGVRWPEPGRT